MGGYSFKCALCEKWFINPKSARDHLYNKHKIYKISDLDKFDAKFGNIDFAKLNTGFAIVPK